jgi:hypothetical protein
MKDKILFAVLQFTNKSSDITFTPELIAAYSGTDSKKVNECFEYLAKQQVIKKSILPDAYRLSEQSELIVD